MFRIYGVQINKVPLYYFLMSLRGTQGIYSTRLLMYGSSAILFVLHVDIAAMEQ